MRNLLDHVCKYRAGCQRFHDASHRLDSKEQKAKCKNGLSDVFCTFGFYYKTNDKSDKNNCINIIT